MKVLPVDGNAAGWLDFNGDGIQDGAIGPFDLDGNGSREDIFPATWNDWGSLEYEGSATGGGLIGDVPPDSNPRYVVRLAPDQPLKELGHP